MENPHRFHRDKPPPIIVDSIEHGQENVDVLTRVLGLDDDRQAGWKLENLDRMETPVQTAALRTTQHGRLGQVHSVDLEHDRFVVGTMSATIGVADEDAERYGFDGTIGRGMVPVVGSLVIEQDGRQAAESDRQKAEGEGQDRIQESADPFAVRRKKQESRVDEVRAMRIKALEGLSR